MDADIIVEPVCELARELHVGNSAFNVRIAPRRVHARKVTVISSAYRKIWRENDAKGEFYVAFQSYIRKSAVRDLPVVGGVEVWSDERILEFEASVRFHHRLIGGLRGTFQSVVLVPSMADFAGDSPFFRDIVSIAVVRRPIPFVHAAHGVLAAACHVGILP